MCVVSMIGDHYADHFKQWPTQHPIWQPGPGQTVLLSPVSREEFEELKRTVEEMKTLLKRAKEYDERNNEPDCEVEEKMVLLRKIAELVGVDLDDVLGAQK